MRVLNSRRSVIALLGMGMLLCMNLVSGIDTSIPLASIAIAVAGSNAAQRAMEAKNGYGDSEDAS